MDDRSLDEQSAAGGGSSSAGGAASAGRSGSGSGGSGGAPPETGGASGESPVDGGAPSGGAAGAPEPGGGCNDLDGDGVSDCEQTIAQNSRFMVDVTAWEAEPTLQQAWDERDAQSEPSSGALRVRNTNVAEGPGTMLSGSRQCVAAEDGTGYEAAVTTLIPGGQGGGSAGVAVSFYGSDECGANFIGSITLQLLSATDTWAVARGSFQAPGGTRSMYVRLVTAKPFEQASLEALFDDVLVRQE